MRYASVDRSQRAERGEACHSYQPLGEAISPAAGLSLRKRQTNQTLALSDRKSNQRQDSWSCLMSAGCICRTLTKLFIPPVVSQITYLTCKIQHFSIFVCKKGQIDKFWIKMTFQNNCQEMVQLRWLAPGQPGRTCQCGRAASPTSPASPGVPGPALANSPDQPSQPHSLSGHKSQHKSNKYYLF